MKIALILHESPTRRAAGVEAYVLDLALSLVGAGHEVDCYHPWPGSDRELGDMRTTEHEGVRIHAFPVPIKPDVAARFMDDEIATTLADAVRAGGADVAHVHHLIGFTGAAIPALRKVGIPVVMTVHDAWFCCNQCHFVRYDGAVCEDGSPGPEQCAQCLLERVPTLAKMYSLPAMARLMALRSRFLTAALAQANVLLANSEYTRRNLLRAGLLHSMVRLEPLGVPGFAPRPHIPREGPLRLGYLGNISLKKGLDVLLDAFRELPEGAAELAVHGAPVQPAYYEALVPLMDMPGVFHHGPYDRERLPGILAGLDAVVVPSREESYSLVVRESFLAGVPVVTTRIPAFQEAFAEGEGGLFFRRGDVAGLADILRRLAGDPELAPRLARGIPPVRTMHEDRDMLLALYREIAARPEGASAGQK